MYISTELLIKIALIALTVIHLIFDIIIIIKIKKIKGTPTGLTVGEIFNNVKEAGASLLDYLEPKLPNIVGLIKSITGGEKKPDDPNKEQEK